jgi:hypothetical protein
VVNENTPLVNSELPSGLKLSKWFNRRRLLHAAIFLVLLVMTSCYFIQDLGFHTSHEVERMQWEAERKAFQDEQRQQRQQWDEEKQRHRQEEENDRRKRIEAHLAWSDLEIRPECWEYRSRKAIAVLENLPLNADVLDWCQATDLIFLGATVKPEYCTVSHDAEVSYLFRYCHPDCNLMQIRCLDPA